MGRSLVVSALLAVTVACGKRSSEVGHGAADSTEATSPVAAPAGRGVGDSVAADSLRADSTSTQAPATASSKTPPPLTGYDSAFGPRFTVDSTGKVTPIGKKKP